MPTSFTVVPVEDGAKSSRARDDSDDNNVLREEDEEGPGEHPTPHSTLHTSLLLSSLLCFSGQDLFVEKVSQQAQQPRDSTVVVLSSAVLLDGRTLR